MLRLALRSAVPARRAAAVACAKRSFASYPAHEVVGLPALSPTMESGNLAKWRMKEGDHITAGDIICEIETDKAVVDYEATDDMFLAKILVAEGAENIAVGQPIMVVCDDEESLAGLADFKVDATAAAPAPPPASKAPEETPSPKEQVPVAKPAAAPKAEAKPAPTPKAETKPAPKATTPTQEPVATTTAPRATFAQKWGQGIQKSPIALSLLKKQHAYIQEFGLTGTTPVELK